MNTHTNKPTKSRQSTRLFLVRKTHTTLAALASLALLSAACGDATDEPTPLVHSKEFTLLPAPNCDTVRERLIDTATEQTLRQLFRRHYAGEWSYNGDDPNNELHIYPVDHTETATQTIGDDEPDVFKTDGQYIYTTYANELLILKSSPTHQTAIVGRYIPEKPENNSYARSLLLKGHRVILFSDLRGTRDMDQRRPLRGTRITILDVSDPTTPKVEKHLDIEGQLKNTRIIDNKVFVVTKSFVDSPINLNHWIPANRSSLPNTEWTDDATLLEQRKNHARTIVRQRLAKEFASTNLQTILPRIRTSDADGNVLSTTPMYACTDLYLPRQITPLGLRNITSFDLDPPTHNKPTHIQSTGLLANGWTMYATPQNLYFAMSNRSWSWGNEDAPNETHIHKFELKNGITEPTYAASGKLDGLLIHLNAMSEHDNHLRVATTHNHQAWAGSGTGDNHITILKQNDKTLQQTSSIHGLATDKPILAAHMLGPHAYLVSFNPTAPLYTADLSDPTNPKTRAKLETNGRIHAIHPLTNHSLLTISANDLTDSLHLQIFDTNNPQNPTRTHHHTIPATNWSDAHIFPQTAFTYDAKRQLLAIPTTQENLTTLLLIQANATTGFQEIARISHHDLATQIFCQTRNKPPGCEPDRISYSWSNLRRTIFTNIADTDYIYSLSNVGLKINDLHTPQNQHAAVSFF